MSASVQGLWTVPAGDGVRLSLRANVGWTLWANIVGAAAQWGVLVALAKLGSPPMVGQYALAVAIVTPVVLFSNLQLRSVQTTDVTGEFAFGDYLGLRFVTVLLACAAIGVIVAGGSYGSETVLVIVGVALTRCIDGVSEVYYALVQRHERMDYIARSVLLRSPLALAALAFSVWLTGRVYWGALAQALVSLAVLCLYDVRVARRLNAVVEQMTGTLRPRWLPDNLRRIALSAAPLGIVILLISLQTNIPRYFIEHRWGETGLGIFSALAYVSTAGNLVIDAIGQSATPRLAKLFASRDLRRFRRVLGALLAFAAIGGCAGFLVARLAGPRILAFLYRPEYAAHMDTFMILILAAGLAYVASFIGYAMTAARLFWSQLPVSLLSAAVTVIACWFLVPAHGLRGAAEALLIVSIVRLLASVVILQIGIKSGIKSSVVAAPANA